MELSPEIILATASSVLTGASGWLFGARKRAADITKMESETAKVDIANFNDAIDIWKATAKELHKELEDQRSKQIAEIQRLTKQFEESHHQQQHEINNLRTQVNGLYAKARELESENTRLRNALSKAGINYESLYEA